MILRVVHTTSYTYSAPVFLEPHSFRLHPRSDGYQRPVRAHLQVDPRPGVCTACLDAEGNQVFHAWFDGKTTRLGVRSEFEVETLRVNPFDYIVTEASACRVPAEYSRGLSALLSPYCAVAPACGAVAELARTLARESGGETLAFLSLLARRIFETTERVVREDGGPLPAEETLRTRQGACRDLAVLYVESCRAMGLAARFVSGYHASRETRDRRFMHAWAEVYVPGGGWRGYDPSWGLAVSDRHVAVAASAASHGAAPVSGIFRGDGATSRMAAELTIQIGPPGAGE